jgi:hypothetical protein
LTQETSEALTRPAPSAQPQKKSAQPQKKAKQPAAPNEKAVAKREREAPRATASQKAEEDNFAVISSPRADERRDEGLVTTAGTAWPVLPSTEGAGVSVPGATGGELTEAADDNAVQLVDPNEVNKLDRAAATVSGESSWSTYLLLISGAALAAASALWFFAKMIPMYVRRAAGPRMHMRSEW